jgi:5'-methylthioadenosine phosphorylase
VSQTAGPETVLCAEAGMPYALLGFVTDYANGVADVATPVDTLMRLLRESGAALASTLAAAVARLDIGAIPPVGTHIAWD